MVLHITLGVFFLCLAHSSLHAQDNVFASLSGFPLNTDKWNLVADTRVGDTNGDADSKEDEIILCTAQMFRNGGLFLKEAIDLSQQFPEKVSELNKIIISQHVESENKKFRIGRLGDTINP